MYHTPCSTNDIISNDCQLLPPFLGMKELQSGREFLRQWLHLQIHQWDPLLQQYHHLRLTDFTDTEAAEECETDSHGHSCDDIALQKNTATQTDMTSDYIGQLEEEVNNLTQEKLCPICAFS